MHVFLNGKEIDTSESMLEKLLEEQNILDRNGIAVAINNNVIPRSSWSNERIKNNDNILIITATQGG